MSCHNTIYKKFTGTILQLLVCVLIGLPSSSAQKAPSKEDQVKAAFIYNFIIFTTWPDTYFSDPSDPFIIGIVGHDPFGSFMDELVKEESIQNRRIVVKRFDNTDNLDAHLVFISKESAIPFKKVVSRGDRMLTISDTEDFTEQGGAVEFYAHDNKLKFEVNLEAIERSKASLSSRLLRLARICCAD